MSFKLAALGFSTKIPRWVAHLSSLPCTIDLEEHPLYPESPDYESKIQFLSKNLVPDSLIRVLDSTVDVESAARIFKWASLQKKFHHTADSYRVMILKLGLSGNIDSMDGICQSMIADRCPGAERVFNLLIGEFVQLSKLNEAIRVLENMIRGGYNPSIELFNAVFGLIVEERSELKDFMFVYKEMVKAGRVPNIDTLNYLLQVLFSSGMVDSALDQYKRMEKKGVSPNSKTFQLLIRNLIAADRVGDSISILQELFELGLVPDFELYISVIPLLCREDRFEESMKLFKMMKDSNFTPNLLIYTNLIHQLCKNSVLDNANILLQEMIDAGLTPTDDVFEEIVVGFCKADRIHESIELLEANKVSSIGIHNAVLKYCCNGNRFFLAQNLFDKMPHRDVSSWNVLIHWLCKHSHLRQALQILTRMILSSLLPNSTTYSALVLGFCKIGKNDFAMENFDRVCLNRQVLDSVPYSELVEALCRVDKTSEAVRVFRYMSTRKHPLESSSFNLLLKNTFETKTIEEAIGLRSLAFECGISCTEETNTIVLNGLKHKPRILRIVLAQMLVLGCLMTSESYTVLINSLSSCTTEAGFLFNAMVDERLWPESESLLYLLSSFAKHSGLSVISRAIDELLSKTEVLNSDMYNLLIKGFLMEGDEIEARKLLDSMLEKGWVPDGETHGLLIGSGEGKSVKPHCVSTEEDNISNILSNGFDES